MIRHLTATGLTSTSNIKLTPNPGYRWRILSILGFLSAGDTTGTRSLTFSLLPFQTSGGTAMTLANTGSQSTTVTYGTLVKHKASATDPPELTYPVRVFPEIPK